MESVHTVTHTMPPAAAAALHSSLCFSGYKPSTSILSQEPENLSAAKPKALLHKNPLYTSTHTNLSLQFKEKILCLEIMGVDSGRALSLNPSLHNTSLHSIQSIITFLESKGIHQKDLPRIFGMCPRILTSDIKNDLIPVFNFLSIDLKVPEQNFRRVINKCPRLLVSSAKDQLKPALFYLKRLGFKDLVAYQDPSLLVSSVEHTLIPKLEYLVGLGFSRSEVVRMVLRCPVLFTFSVENNFKPKFEYLVGLGFSRSEVVRMVLRCPVLFTFSVENNFKPKFEYFRNQMGGELEDLKRFPQYFAFSLEKRIKPRHAECVETGVKVPLHVMLKATDEEFKKLIIGDNKDQSL